MTLDKLKALDKDDMLNMLGLETRRTPVDYIVPAVVVFGVGLLVGAGVGLLLAPKPGRELREDIAHRLHDAPDVMARLPHRANEAMHRVSEQITGKPTDGPGKA